MLSPLLCGYGVEPAIVSGYVVLSPLLCGYGAEPAIV